MHPHFFRRWRLIFHLSTLSLCASACRSLLVPEDYGYEQVMMDMLYC
jgi:hypothetical protein